MRRPIYLLVPILLCATPAWAKDQAQPVQPVQPQVFQSVVECRTQADPAQRLACYDHAVAALAAAADNRQVMVVDRASVDKTKRSLFGLSLPTIKLFGDNEVDLDKIDTTLASVSSSRDGATIYVLPDGAMWKQTDGRDTFAKAGQTIEIRRGSLGGYFARINGQAGVRVIRLSAAR